MRTLLEKTVIVGRIVMRKVTATVVAVWGPGIRRDLLARSGCRGDAVDLVYSVTVIEEEDRAVTTKSGGLMSRVLR